MTLQAEDKTSEQVDNVAPGVSRVRPIAFPVLAQSSAPAAESRPVTESFAEKMSSRISLMPSALRAYVPAEKREDPMAAVAPFTTERVNAVSSFQAQEQLRPLQRPAPVNDMEQQLAPLRGISKELVARGMPAPLVSDLLATIVAEYGQPVLESERDARFAIVEELLARCPETPLIPENDLLTGLVLVTGPAGSGKSVLISHLALAAARAGQRDVILVNSESGRIGAAAQMNAIGDVFGYPVEHVYSPQDLRVVRNRASKDTLILVETAGWMPPLPGSDAQATPWRWRMPGAKVVVCVPATGQATDLNDILAATKEAAPDSVAVLTKSDQTRNVLPALGALAMNRQAVGMVMPGPDLADESPLRLLGDVARSALGVVLPQRKRGRLR